ncbi:hypothetical protein SCA6_004426 [Theobroma cacao]
MQIYSIDSYMLGGIGMHIYRTYDQELEKVMDLTMLGSHRIQIFSYEMPSVFGTDVSWSSCEPDFLPLAMTLLEGNSLYMKAAGVCVAVTSFSGLQSKIFGASAASLLDRMALVSFVSKGMRERILPLGQCGVLGSGFVGFDDFLAQNNLLLRRWFLFDHSNVVKLYYWGIPKCGNILISLANNN